MELNESDILVNILQNRLSHNKEEHEIIMSTTYPAMRFKTGGLDVILCIRGYREPNRQTNEKNWLKIDLEILADDRVILQKKDRECLLSSEIDSLIDLINRIRISEKDAFVTEAFNEPDMTFEFTNIGSEFERLIEGRWDVSLDKFGLSSHTISINLNHKEIELLRAYLLFVTGRQNRESFEVNRWINDSNIIYKIVKNSIQDGMIIPLES